MNGFSRRKSPLSSDKQSGSASMCKLMIMVLAACVGLAGPAAVADAGLLSATRLVIAVLAGDLYLGEAKGHLDGAGTVAIHAQKNPALTCLGQFTTSSAAQGGTGQMRCSDDTTATFLIKRLSVFRGHGAGKFSRGPMSFAYGLTAEEAGPYLKLPAGKKLVHNGTELELVNL